MKGTILKKVDAKVPGNKIFYKDSDDEVVFVEKVTAPVMFRKTKSPKKKKNYFMEKKALGGAKKILRKQAEAEEVRIAKEIRAEETAKIREEIERARRMKLLAIIGDPEKYIAVCK